MGGKIKGSEFIFALIATELRNCLTGKIAPAQANYIHLLSLLAFVGAVLFYLNGSRLSHFLCFSLHILSLYFTRFLLYFFIIRQRCCSISSYFRNLSLVGVFLSLYYLIWNNRIIRLIVMYRIVYKLYCIFKKGLILPYVKQNFISAVHLLSVLFQVCTI